MSLHYNKVISTLKTCRAHKILSVKIEMYSIAYYWDRINEVYFKLKMWICCQVQQMCAKTPEQGLQLTA